MPVESNPHILPEHKLQDSAQPLNSVPDTVTKMTEIARSPDPIPDTKDSELENTSDAISDAQTAGVTPNLQNVSDSHASVPNSIIPMPHSQSAIPVDLQNTEMITESKATNCAVSADTTPICTTPQTTPRSAGPRRAASSSSVIGADPIASSGDIAIDSDDVVVMPKDVEDDVLEIAHLNHDWLDKVSCMYIHQYAFIVFACKFSFFSCRMHAKQSTLHK